MPETVSTKPQAIKVQWKKALESSSIVKMAPMEEIRPYIDDARALAEQQMRQIARRVGQGRCSVGPGVLVITACLMHAAVRYQYDKWGSTGDSEALRLCAKLEQGVRMNLKTAMEMAAMEAEAVSKNVDTGASRLAGAFGKQQKKNIEVLTDTYVSDDIESLVE